MMSQQRWWNENGGRSELSEVISRVKMRLYQKQKIDEVPLVYILIISNKIVSFLGLHAL